MAPSSLDFGKRITMSQVEFEIQVNFVVIISVTLTWDVLLLMICY